MSWTDSTLFFRMLVVAFRTFLWPSYQVSGRTCCKHVAPSTHPFHNTIEGQTRLHYRSTCSWLSQAVSCSSGMWHQEMLPSIPCGCHFDTISSFSIKNFVPDIFDQTSYVIQNIWFLWEQILACLIRFISSGLSAWTIWHVSWFGSEICWLHCSLICMLVLWYGKCSKDV
jgi:hypothetical protein